MTVLLEWLWLEDALLKLLLKRNNRAYAVQRRTFATFLLALIQQSAQFRKVLKYAHKYLVV